MWINPETLASVLEGHLYARHLLFAVPPEVSYEQLAVFAEEKLLECGITGSVGLFFKKTDKDGAGYYREPKR